MVGTYDQSAGAMKLYLDASVDATASASGSIDRYYDGDYVVNSGEARVGRCLSSNNNGACYFDGTLDEVRVYDRALTDAEITHLATMDDE